LFKIIILDVVAYKIHYVPKITLFPSLGEQDTKENIVRPLKPWYENTCADLLSRIDFLLYPVHMKTEKEHISEI
jgi:hypothetical protein